MKKMRKAFTTIMATLLVSSNVLSITACSPNESGTGDIVPYDGSAVTVTFYHTMGAALQNILDEYIVEFNKIYPNITISHDTMGDYPALKEQIMTELAGGNSPSMAYCYPDHVALYQKAKKALVLDDYINSDEKVTLNGVETDEIMGYTSAQIDDFIPAYYNEGKAYGDNKMYTLPIMKSTEVLYYNKDYFEKNNLTVPTTWDEMETVCEQIKALNPTDIPLGYDSEANWFITMTEQLGTPYTSVDDDHFLFNTEENRKFVERFRNWYDLGYITTEEIYGNYTSNLFKETDPAKQKIYMCIGSSAGATYQCPALTQLPVYDEDGNPVYDPDTGAQLEEEGYPFEVGVAMIPQANPSSPKVIQQGPSVCLFKKSNSQEMAAAWLFTKFLTTSVEYQARVSMNNGYTSVIQSVKDNPVYANFLNSADGNKNLQATVVLQTLAQTNAYYISPAFNGSSAAREKVGVLLQNCLVTKLDGSGYSSAANMIKAQFDAAIEALNYDYS